MLRSECLHCPTNIMETISLFVNFWQDIRGKICHKYWNSVRHTFIMLFPFLSLLWALLSMKEFCKGSRFLHYNYKIIYRNVDHCTELRLTFSVPSGSFNPFMTNTGYCHSQSITTLYFQLDCKYIKLLLYLQVYFA